MAKSFYEAVIASGGFAGESFDIAAGPANTDVIDVLLNVNVGSNPSVLTENCPVSLTTSGTLTADVEVDLSNVEQDGRFIFLSVRNSDIATNTITLTPTTSINGVASWTINSISDWMLVHESGGAWKIYRQKTSTAEDAYIFRGTFAAVDWSNGTNNRITIIRTGAPAAGQIGPHNLAQAGSYVIQVYRDSDDELVDVGVVVDDTTGNITLSKTSLGQNFAGRVIVIGN